MADKNEKKLPVADREAARLLAIQTNETMHRRVGDLTLIALFLSAIFTFAVLFWVLPDRAVSETENRDLASLPKFTAERLLEGKYTSEIADYMADQFPARDFFVTVSAFWDRVLLRGAHNGILFGEDGTLIPRDNVPNTDNIKTNLEAIDAFASYCKARGIPTLTAITGRTADVLSHTLPDYAGEYSARLWAALDEAASVYENANLLLLSEPLKRRAEAGEYVYYRTDHHWTTLGAFYGAAEILSALGKDSLPPASYTREVVSESFTGTAWSTSGAFWTAPDTMEFFRYEGDGAFTTAIVDNGTSFEGFYDRAYLTKKDKYSAFIGGNHGLVTVTKNGGTDRPTMLLLKDSFAHAAVPFLAEQFDLVIVDLRYYKKLPVDLPDEYGIDTVLFLYNADTLTASASQRLLTAGLEK